MNIELFHIDESDRSEIRYLKHLINEARQTNHFLKEIKDFMSTVPSGLAALQKAQADVLAAIQAGVAKIADLSSQLSALNSEDPAVQAIAADLESSATALTNAVNPPAPEPTA